MGTTQVVSFQNGKQKTRAASRIFINGYLAFPPQNLSNGFEFSPDGLMYDLGEDQLGVYSLESAPYYITTEGAYAPYPVVIFNWGWGYASQFDVWVMELLPIGDAYPTGWWSGLGINTTTPGEINYEQNPIDPRSGNTFDVCTDPILPGSGFVDLPVATTTSGIGGLIGMPPPAITLAVSGMTGIFAGYNGMWNLQIGGLSYAG